MRSLIIDTSTERGIVALMDGEKQISFRELPFGYSNSKYLLPAINELLQAQNIEVSQLEMIVVGIGPGSYTGIRVGAVTAKTLAFASNVPLVGVCSLEGFVPKSPGVFVAMIDAKISGAYLLKGKMDGDGKVEYHSQPMVCPIDQLESYLKDVKVVVSPVSTALREKLHKQYPDISLEWEERCPSPLYLARAALRKYASGDISRDGTMELLYLRKTQAEIEREAKGR